MEYEVSLLEALQDAGDVKSFRFTRPEGYDFLAGQFCALRLPEVGKKYFSFSNSPTEEGYLQFTTRMSGSDYKNALGALAPGGGAVVSSAMGKFTWDPAHGKIAFLSGGIGITPVRSICRFLADTGAPCSVRLVYGNRDETCVPFMSDLHELAARSADLKTALVLERPVGEWSGHRGFITGDVLAQELPDLQERTFYVCGPPIMVEVMVKLLDALKVDKAKIRIENFAGY